MTVAQQNLRLGQSEEWGQRLTIRHFRLIIAIHQEQHLVGAAKRLGLTQPAVTKCLQEIERLVGGRVFIRGNRGVIPTRFADILYRHGMLILNQIASAEEELADVGNGLQGSVVVGSSPSGVAQLLPMTIERIRNERPQVSVDIVEGRTERLLPLLRCGSLDCVIGMLPRAADIPSLDYESLFYDFLCIVCGTNTPFDQTDSIAALQSVPWIMPKGDAAFRARLNDAFRAAGIAPPAAAIETDSQYLRHTMVENCGYFSIWPFSIASMEQRSQRIRILPIELRSSTSQLAVFTRRGSHLSPAARYAVSAICDAAREIRNRWFGYSPFAMLGGRAEERV